MATKIGLFYGTTTGKTGDVATLIKEEFGEDLVVLHDIGLTKEAELLTYNLLIIGCPTWNVGELQDDWDSFYPLLDTVDFTGKKVAYFGTGDQAGYSDTFEDAMGILEEKISGRGGITVGLWSTDGYDFDASRALRGDKFVGLALDEDNQSELTPLRVRGWVAQLRQEFGV